jgi:superfamily II DNA or RNA helicase
MRKLKLSQNEINNLIKIENKFKKRDYIQELGINYFVQYKGNLLCTWATSLGKTVLGIKIIKGLRKLSNREIHITVPTDTLKKQWDKQVKDLNNVTVFTIHSYCKLKNPSPFLLICDECHIGLGSEDSEAFNKINYFKAKYKLYLSATLKVAQKKFIEKTAKIKTEFNITIKEAEILNLVPKFKVYNVRIPFTSLEKFHYINAETTKQKSINYFGFLGFQKIPHLKSFPIIIDPNTKKDITKEAKLMAFFWMKARNKQVSLIYKAENKLRVLKEIYPFIKTKKTIFFSKFQKNADDIYKINKDKIGIYHTGIKKNIADKHLQNYLDNISTQISSVNKLIAGLDDECSDMIIRSSFDSTELSGIQSLGRILRVNPNDPDKAPVMINFVMEVSDGLSAMDNYWIRNSMRTIEVEEITLEKLKKLEL